MLLEGSKDVWSLSGRLDRAKPPRAADSGDCACKLWAGQHPSGSARVRAVAQPHPGAMTSNALVRESSLVRRADTSAESAMPCGGDQARLLERDRHLSELATLISRRWDRPTGAVVIEGRVGYGKTALVGAASRAAREAGYEVLRAAADQESGELLSLLRQLDGLPFRDAWRRGGDERERRLEHLMATIGELAQGAGVLIAVDDAHWLTPASVAWLGELVGPGADPGIRLMLSALPRAPRSGLRPLDAVLSRPGTRTISLEPLSRQAVTTLVQRRLGRAGAGSLAGFATACHRATGGVPGLLIPLLGELDTGGPPRARTVAAGVASPAVARSVLRRLAALPSGCTRVLEVMTVAGGTAEPETIEQVTGLSHPEIDLAAAGLASLDLLDAETGFSELVPLVQSSFYNEIAGSRRSALHLGIAQSLRAAAPPEAVAAHLMASDEGRRAWVADELLRAAVAARDQGRTEAALAFTRRALLEQPALLDEPEVLLDLAGLEANCDPAAALEHLSTCTDKGCSEESLHTAAALAIELASGAQDSPGHTCGTGPSNMLATVIDRLVPALGPGDPQTTRLVVARVLACAAGGAGLAELLGSPAASFMGVDPEREALRAVVRLAGGTSPLAPVRDRLGELLALGVPGSGGALGAELWARALLGLSRCGGFELAERVCREASRAAEIGGDLRAEAEFTLSLALSLRLRGLLEEALACARGALCVSGAGAWRRRHDAVACVAGCLIDLGRLEEAETALSLSPGLETRVPPLEGPSLLVERGRLRLRQGRVGCAVEDLTAAGGLATAAGVCSPAVTNWRRVAVEALAAMGARQPALELAEEEWCLAQRTGLDWLVGGALVGRSLAESGGARLRLLAQAAERLEDSPLQLEEAETLIELGAAYVESGDTAAARARLWRGTDIASRLGASPLLNRALPLLRRSGARPRRSTLSGPASLTPSEARVVRLAADGLKNSEIAARVFLAEKTVEGHLMRGYRKLGVRSRSELKGALPDGALPGETDGPSEYSAQRDRPR